MYKNSGFLLNDSQFIIVVNFMIVIFIQYCK